MRDHKSLEKRDMLEGKNLNTGYVIFPIARGKIPPLWRDLFLQYFDDYDQDVYQKLLNHPFLKTSTDRFLVFFEMRISNIILLQLLVWEATWRHSCGNIMLNSIYVELEVVEMLQLRHCFGKQRKGFPLY